jgi:hypothetical protein
LIRRPLPRQVLSSADIRLCIQFEIAAANATITPDVALLPTVCLDIS